MPAASLAPIAGLAVVAILVGSTLLNGSPVVPPADGSPAPTGIAITTEDIAVLARNADGSLEVRTAGVGEVCPLAADPCEAAEPSFEASQVARINAGDRVDSAIISPARDSMVVVGRDASGTNGLYVVPVRPAVAVTSTPAPTQAPTATPTATPTARTHGRTHGRTHAGRDPDPGCRNCPSRFCTAGAHPRCHTARASVRGTRVQ